MKRSPRIIFNAIAALSLLLCIATTILWAGTRSSGHTFLFCRITGGSIRTMSFFQVWSAAGGVRLMIGRQRSDWALVGPPPDPPTFAHGSYDFGPNPYPIDNSPRDQTLTAGPFQISRLSEMQSNFGQQQLSITVPTWFLLALFALPPALWIRHTRLRAIETRRRASSRCVKCGYDLRATPDCCPECGAIPIKPPVNPAQV